MGGRCIRVHIEEILQDCCLFAGHSILESALLILVLRLLIEEDEGKDSCKRQQESNDKGRPQSATRFLPRSFRLFSPGVFFLLICILLVLRMAMRTVRLVFKHKLSTRWTAGHLTGYGYAA